MASNPYGITQVDAPGLLQGYVGAQRQRLADMYTQAQFQRQQKQDERVDATMARQDTARELIAKGAKPEEVIAADPDTGFAYAKHAADLAEHQREEQGKRAQAVGNAAMFVSRLPATEQPAAWDQAIDQLVGQGYTDLAPYKGKYDPKSLPALIAASEEASKAYYSQSDKDRSYAETVRSHRASEANSAANTGISAANLALSRQREARVTKWGPQPLIGAVGAVPTNTDDLGY